jgi:hypothetical protein
VSRVVKVSSIFHREIRAVTNGISAFSAATLLMLLQGSFGDIEGSLIRASLLFSIAIPFCLAGATLSFFFCQRKTVSPWADRTFDSTIIIGWVAGAVGFFQLIISISGLLAITFATAVGLAFSIFFVVARSLVNQEDSSDSDSDSDS